MKLMSSIEGLNVSHLRWIEQMAGAIDLYPGKGSRFRRHPRILVIDDDPTFGMLIERAAKTKDIQVTVCKNQAELFELTSLDYDVAVVDYYLEGIDGIELATQLRKANHGMGVILVSADAEIRKRIDKEVRYFLPKSKGARRVVSVAESLFHDREWIL